MPVCPVNQMRPLPSKAAVLRLAAAREAGSGQAFTSLLMGSTRTMAFCPPSVTQAAPSGPTITPCGAESFPSGIRSTVTRLGIKTTQDAGSLTGVPDRAIRRGRHVMWMLSWLQGKIFRLRRPAGSHCMISGKTRTTTAKDLACINANLEPYSARMKAAPPTARKFRIGC